MKSIERPPISAVNLVLVVAFLLGTLAAGAPGSRPGAAHLATLGLSGLGCALFARHAGSRDVTRLNALEW